MVCAFLTAIGGFGFILQQQKLVTWHPADRCGEKHHLWELLPWSRAQGISFRGVGCVFV